ncbi:helix-turn-helix domain-containing protein [Lactococcus garvieae]|nr:helix-turn-helix domain-containing protein [Lactococcus garvieae]MCI3860184.1 helix-turn-helix domain-containing protein [Lactococcus garvieae]
MDNLLKSKRLEKKMTLEQVGEIVGVGKSTVRKWENGMIENMGRDKIVLLSKALDISPLEILGMDDNELVNTTSSTKQILNNIFDKLKDERQDNILKYAQNQLDQQNQEFEKEKIIVLDKKKSRDIDDEEIDWNEWVAFDGRPMSDHDKKIIKDYFGDELKD